MGGKFTRSNVSVCSKETVPACFICDKYTTTHGIRTFFVYNYSATDMQLIPLELVKSNCDSVRKAREAYLIERGQTLEPHGLNKRDET